MIEVLRDEIAEALLDLEGAVIQQYGAPDVHDALVRKYLRDMKTVEDARSALEKLVAIARKAEVPL